MGTHGDEPLDSSGKCQSFRGQAHSTLTRLEGLASCSVLKVRMKSDFVMWVMHSVCHHKP